MKRFVRYLYENQNGRKVRNVGFVKVEDSGDVLALWVYGKGFPAAVSGGWNSFFFISKTISVWESRWARSSECVR